MLQAAWLVDRMGPGWSERLGLRPADGGEPDLFGWWVACILRAGERREDPVGTALAALRRAGLLGPVALAAAAPDLAPILAGAGLREPEPQAARLARGAAALLAGFGGSLERLAGGAPDLEELGGRLVALVPGFGPGSAVRFLRPLRDRWPAADGLPLDPAALAAAIHLGWLDEHDDPETAPGTLRRRLELDAPGSPPLPVVEDALERLGRAACRRGRTARCPLGADCRAV
jgi:hypothetical protein